MFLIGMLLLSMVMVDINAVPVAKLCVDIPCWVGWYGHEFVANANITDVEDLYGFEFKLGWDTTWLDLVGAEISPPAEWGTDYVIAKNETTENYNATHGRYWLNVSALAPAPSFNGSMILAKLTFNVTYMELAPPWEKWFCLDLHDTKLKDPEGLPISHEVYDGFLVIPGVCPCIPEVKVMPDYYEATTLGENFTIYISFALYNAYFEFRDWKAKLGYNTTLLDVIKVEEGPFLGYFRTSDKRYFAASIHEEEGYVNMSGGILGTCATPYGGGTIAKVTFNVTHVTTFPTIATCVLDLYDTNFTMYGPGPDVDDGYYQAPYACVDITDVLVWLEPPRGPRILIIPEVYITWDVRVNVTVHNDGTVPINCTVNAYYYNVTTNLMGTQNLTNLDPCNSATLKFTWDVSGLPEEAVYTVKANATCTCGANDEFVYGQVKIRLLGDPNGDGVVDIIDIKIIKLVYMRCIENPFADLDGDGVVNILDVKRLKMIYSGWL